MRTVLICHQEDPINREGMARWLNSFSTLAGMVVLKERSPRKWKRIRREMKRVGVLRFLDVLAFRLYYRLALARRDREWEREAIARLRERYPAVSNVPTLTTHSPNSTEAEQFIRAARPDIILARCKTILKPAIFTQAAKGTYVMHPGICPEYRNAHGCFWALAEGDLENVGLTLLRVDAGVDTGPVYGYYRANYDETRESHFVIQHRVALDNLERIAERFREIGAGSAQPLDTSGRRSAAWGQPWLSKYLAWKRQARRRTAPFGRGSV